ncbi:conserved hypothetical protein [Histoplasma capsulatum var. duboisii H88]|uniref:Uncharacterized protein n=1 Tax=Ajellomyces capsulatus (strain H88) TaxID=544711 RepID=F0U932_AJEC8|nr:conserved hypothetical protein [Histoplasma capsulatum var. duboisii H88]QSS51755.1 hypothetical protein I7I53_07164 [Histoplasma capsulatum var. duboisii H88]
MGDPSGKRDGLRSGIITDDMKAPSAQSVFNAISRAVNNAHQETDLTYDNIDASDASLIISSLDESPTIESALPKLSYNSLTRKLNVYIMPTRTHDSHQTWIIKEVVNMLNTNYITLAEFNELHFMTGTTIRGFQGPWAGSIKQPDMGIGPEGENFPTVVIESGWSESFPGLHRDMQLWLGGSVGKVELVILLKWTKIVGNFVKGMAEAWSLDSTGQERLLQSEIIFPEPQAGSVNQAINVTRGQLLGSRLPAGRTPSDIFGLSLSNLRTGTVTELRIDGYRPA